MKRVLIVLVGCVAVAAAGGCGGDAKVPHAEQIQQQGREKVQAMQNIADALQKGDQQEALGALEAFRSIPFNPADYPKETEEIAQIYRTKVQPKAKGEFAAELRVEVEPLIKLSK